MRKIILCFGFVVTATVSFAQQWAGSTSTTGDISRTGNVGIGTSVLPRSFNIFKTHVGLPIIGAPIESYTTGFRITHNWAGTGAGPYTPHQYDFSADANRLYLTYFNTALPSTGTPLMSITKEGKIGIGTNLPDYLLHIKNTNMGSGTAVRVDAINGHIRLFETDGSNPESYTQIERNGNIFQIYQRDITSPNFEHVFAAAMDGNVGFGEPSAHPDIKMFVENREKKVGLYINNTQTSNDHYGLKCVVNNATTRALAVTGVSDGKDVFRVMGNGVVWCTELNVDVKGDFPDYVFDKNYKLMPLDDLKHFVEIEKHLPNVPTAKEVAENGIAVSKMAVVQTEKIEELTLYVLQLNEAMKKLQTQNEALQKRIAELESK